MIVITFKVDERTYRKFYVPTTNMGFALEKLNKVFTNLGGKEVAKEPENIKELLKAIATGMVTADQDYLFGRKKVTITVEEKKLDNGRTFKAIADIGAAPAEAEEQAGGDDEVWDF
ncbi:MAG: hypothetical protein D6746_07150 [Bacteroidetes bacterium]|nr:MAG: hypothetical protein D6746_07150 [Bacteroidota bacterium]